MDSSPGNPITPTKMPATTNTKSTTRKGVSGCEMRQIRLTLAAHESALIGDAPAQLTVEGSAKLMLAQMYR